MPDPKCTTKADTDGFEPVDAVMSDLRDVGEAFSEVLASADADDDLPLHRSGLGPSRTGSGAPKQRSWPARSPPRATVSSPHAASFCSSRKTRIAFVLGLLSPGMGHLYVGAPTRALAAFAVVCVVILPAMRLAAMVLSWSPLAMIGGVLLAVILWLLVPLDGCLTAVRRAGRATAPRNWTWLYLVYGPAAFLLVLLANLWIGDHFWLRTFRVPSPSMAPTLLPGDYVLADMRLRDTATLGTGEIIVFADAEKPFSFFIKRIAALAGETAELRGDRALMAEPMRNERTQKKPRTLVVPEGHVFVLGDNLSQSIDSRYWGPLPTARIRGRAYRIYFSRDPVSGRVRWERMGRALGPR